ncbi:MAG: hypothetical protein HDR05_11735 [Lachnospiraceae bacterium]|nr:hypothetical protein [Lachnospiraceae bacterium]
MATTEDKKVCFVITPIGDNNSDIRRHIDGIIDQAIEPALGEKYEIEVAHRKYEIGSINDRVVKSVFEADLVIANLTSLNPNVMYELAIRYSFGKPAIVIAEERTKLPFDVVDENTIFYVNDPAGANELKQKLIEFEKNINFGKKEHGPVFKVINKIPLYNDVESGENVSEKQLLQYIIDRVDSLEKSINFKGQNASTEVLKKTRKRKITIEFFKLKDESFENDEVDKIMAYMNYYALTELNIEKSEKHLVFSFLILDTELLDLTNFLRKWESTKKSNRFILHDT